MRVANYDAVYAYCGRWIESRGTVMFVQAQYRAWGVFLGSGAAVTLMWLTLGSGPVEALFRGAVLGLVAAVGVMRFVERDVTITGLAASTAREAWDAARTRLSRRPVGSWRARLPRLSDESGVGGDLIGSLAVVVGLLAVVVVFAPQYLDEALGLLGDLARWLAGAVESAVDYVREAVAES